jgi:bifunctional non-homologous end joining protein LigD
MVIGWRRWGYVTAAGRETPHMATSRDAKLQTYRAKRNKGKTPEPYPSPGRAKKAAGSRQATGPSFVIQEHHARALHWDFRLERDGVLVSWALPKGLPMDPGQNHLAVPTEDHPLEYGSFEGTIPQGEYGGGEVTIWDSGTYDCEKWNEKEVMITLHGKGQAKGRYVLFPTGSKRWMIHRMDPAPAQWAPLPAKVAPMLCTLGQLPVSDEGWAYEFKWDGERIIAFIEGGRIRLVTRNGNDVTGTYPELADMAESVGARPMVLDGEVVAYDGEHPSFSLLQSRMRVTDRNRARKLAQDTPVTYLVFDVLYLDGASTTELSYDERRRLLDELHLAGPRWQTPPTFADAVGLDILQISKDHGLEGVVVKRRESRYRPGRRSPRLDQGEEHPNPGGRGGGMDAGGREPVGDARRPPPGDPRRWRVALRGQGGDGLQRGVAGRHLPPAQAARAQDLTLLDHAAQGAGRGGPLGHPIDRGGGPIQRMDQRRATASSVLAGPAPG